jgi:hypothetical protein
MDYQSGSKHPHSKGCLLILFVVFSKTYPGANTHHC